MARKRKGNPVHGWLVVDKPAGVTSAAVVNKARWALRAQKAGHSGTLDPDATGCLVIAFGEATKVIPIAQEGLKTYRFLVRWGQSTTTDDAAGEVIEDRATRPSAKAIEQALPGFLGEIQQVPPKVSAVKVAGERAYDLARKSEAFDLEARPLWVEELSLRSIPDQDHAEFELICGKGGYVRAIARDLGEALGCLGHVRWLHRLSTGPFDLSSAVSFADLDGFREFENAPTLLPLHHGLSALPRIDVTERQAEDLRHGREIQTSSEADGPAWTAAGNQVIAIGRTTGGIFHPDRVILPY
ncbi:MAG: tRNA pseudouridine(55) synthase TruB [Pseudomonadota bacterium]